MISDEYKVVFAHIDKTGGSSITSMLNNGGREETKYKHKTLLQMVNNDNKDYYKFAFVRNPYERVLSKYYHDVKIARPDKPGSTRDCNNFNDWIIKHQRDLGKFLRTQYSYVYDKSGNIMADFIGRFENLENDVEIIKEKLGLKANLEHKNKNPIKKDIDWLSEYTKQGIEIVNRIYLCDFKSFCYEIKY